MVKAYYMLSWDLKELSSYAKRQNIILMSQKVHQDPYKESNSYTTLCSFSTGRQANPSAYILPAIAPAIWKLEWPPPLPLTPHPLGECSGEVPAIITFSCLTNGESVLICVRESGSARQSWCRVSGGLTWSKLKSGNIWLNLIIYTSNRKVPIAISVPYVAGAFSSSFGHIQ